MFPSISGRLPEKGRKRREKIEERKNVQLPPPAPTASGVIVVIVVIIAPEMAAVSHR